MLLVDGEFTLRGKAFGGAHKVLKTLQDATAIVKVVVRIFNGDAEATVSEAMSAP